MHAIKTMLHESITKSLHFNYKIVDLKSQTFHAQMPLPNVNITVTIYPFHL